MDARPIIAQSSWRGTVNDEFGTPYQILGLTGGSLYLADFESFGWRKVFTSWVTSAGVTTWTPFALPGQLIFTEAAVRSFVPGCYTSSSSCPILSVRPPLHQNRLRDYDPYVGRFLEEDPLDEQRPIGRARPYYYADNRPLSVTDPSGLDPDIRCGTAADSVRVLQAVRNAIQMISECENSNCPAVYGDKLEKGKTAGGAPEFPSKHLMGKLKWRALLWDARITCVNETGSEGGGCGQNPGFIRNTSALYNQIEVSKKGAQRWLRLP